MTAGEHDASSGSAGRVCGWCREALSCSQRRDARYCSQRCRQAAHRFGRGRGMVEAAERPCTFGYADPPYPGRSAKYYRDHPDYAGEVDHVELCGRLARQFPDGWALSTSADALRSVLASCGPEVRVAAWVRGERPTRSYGPLSSWEPVVFAGGRREPSSVDDRRLDSLVHIARPRTTDPDRVVGSKPADFCYWMFRLLGARVGDELVDLFPGSGGVARAWQVFQGRGVALDVGAGVSVSSSERVAEDLADASAARAQDDGSTRRSSPANDTSDRPGGDG